MTAIPTLTRSQPRAANTAPDVAALPPAGPAWFSCVMGTGILALLVQLHLGGTAIGSWAAALWLALAWTLLIGLSVGFVRHCRLDRTALRLSISDPTRATAWGTVAMGILSVGAATLKITAAHGDRLAALGQTVDLVLWSLGTVLGFVTAVGFGLLLIRRDCGRPAMTWGLPVVPPMVSATTGATLAPMLPAPWHVLCWLVSAVAFLVAAILGLVIFAAAYHHHLRTAPIPIVASATSWIPLGVVGQSTAAAVALFTAAEPALRPRAAGDLESVVHGYGYVMLLIAVPVVWFAARTTLRGFRARMPFAPNWWSLTFPIGTLSLGAHLLSAQTGQGWVTAIGWVALAVLVGTWSLCATASLRAVRVSWCG